MKKAAEKILVSACLLGQKVRYDGGHSASGAEILERWREMGQVVAFCPEVAGGLGTPRPPAEIIGGDGEAVLDGRARVVTEAGVDVTDAFIKGAQGLLASARRHGARMAVLKARSPSCGSFQIYDGTFGRDSGQSAGQSSGARLVAGMGVSAALLRRHGIKVFNEAQFVEAQAWLDER